MAFETLAILFSMFRHGHQEQDLDIEAGDLGVQQGNLALDQSRLFKVSYPPPARRSRHTDEFRQLALIARGVSLQFDEEATVGTCQFHWAFCSLFSLFWNICFFLSSFYAQFGH
jgi:hypothetical protein